MPRRSIFDFKTFDLSNKDAVDWYLQKQEVIRDARIEKAGLRKALLVEGTPYTVWTDIMAKVSGDTLDLFKVLREVPSICDPGKTSESIAAYKKDLGSLSRLTKKRKIGNQYAGHVTHITY